MNAACAFVAVWLASAAAGGVPDQQVAIRAAFQAAEAMQGPLDGLWRLTDRNGRVLFVFALSDAGGPPAPLAAKPDDPALEGAWRDPNREGERDASGLVDSVRRERGRLSLRFVAGPDRRLQTLSLNAIRNGRWTGALTGAGPRRGVIMSRF